MRVQDFDFDHFLKYKEEKDAAFAKFDRGEIRGPVMTQRTLGRRAGFCQRLRREAILEREK